MQAAGMTRWRLVAWAVARLHVYTGSDTCAAWQRAYSKGLSSKLERLKHQRWPHPSTQCVELYLHFYLPYDATFMY